MILMEPPNYAPTDQDVRTARLVLGFSMQEMLNGLGGASSHAEMAGYPAVVFLLDDRIDSVKRILQGADNLIIAAVERHDNRLDGRPGKEQDGEETEG